MKKLVLALFLISTQFALVWDTRANDHVLLFLSPKSTVNGGLSQAATASSDAKTSFINRFWPFKNRHTTVSAPRLLLSEDNPSAAKQAGDLLFSNDKVRVSNVYPNPASSVASFKYDVLSDNIGSVKIVIYDVLANVVGEYYLTRDVHEINISTVDLTSGVYFYTLSVGGKNVATRKLIVKHQS